MSAGAARKSAYATWGASLVGSKEQLWRKEGR